jgi:nitrogen-specific signal transduction histidine kinase
VKLLANPLFLKMALGFIIASFAFVVGVLFIRHLRKSLTQDEMTEEGSAPSTQSFPFHTYHAVIQQLKQQKHELTAQQQAERRRSKVTENISAAVLSNLSSGVVFFNTQGLVRQANPAAKQILGYASPVGMSAHQLFRMARLSGSRVMSSEMPVAEAVQTALHDGSNFRQLAAEYTTPAGEERALDVTISPVSGVDGSLLGAACLINDQTTMAQIRRQQEKRGELSAEMALALRNSLVTISGYAQQLAQNRDPDMARQLAADIAAEASHLDRTIGGFLAEAKAAAAGS